MGSGNNLTPITSGLLRRRYSVPEIIMRKHNLAQQKCYDESVATTAPTPHISPLPGYSRANSTSTSRRDYTLSSGSDSNLSRHPERGEMSMRKSTLLRRIWSRELKRYDTRSGSWSPPMRRSQRRLHNEPVESHRCEECRKLEEEDPELEEASRKRLRLISTGKEPSDEISPSVGYSRSISERLQVTTPSSLGSSPLSNGRQTNVHIFMTPIKSNSTSEPGDQAQDMLRVEIELENDETNGNSISPTEKTNSSDLNDNRTGDDSTTTTMKSENGNGDTPLDRFISKLLIDNLADLADEINEQFEHNNNLRSKNTDSRTTKVSSVYLSPEHLEAVVNRSHTDVPTACSTISPPDISDSNKCTEDVSEKVIYFPSCSLECKDDMSSYTSNNSEFELNNLPSTDLVKVSTGSTYHVSDQIEPVVVSRHLSNFPRTESLEANPSSASMLEEDNANDSEDSVSLVDSLDDPVIGSEEIIEHTETEKEDFSEINEQGIKQEDPSPNHCEKGEAFFVPIEGSDLEEVQSQPVAESMPEKLKEKILQRQRDLDTKREEEIKKKQKKIEKIMDRKLEEENFFEKSPVLAKKELVTKEKEKSAIRKSDSNVAKSSKTNTTILRSEIGLLESYTIDSKGNMQFKGPQKTDSSASGKKNSTTKAPITRKHGVVTIKPPQPQPQQSSQKKFHVQSKPKKSIVKDVQKMTIFQAQSDIITPDHENGPRRVYQKTEIQDGEKRIEILEIVECIESSPESSPDRYYTYRCTSKSAISRRSKIPIPVYKAGRSAGFQKSIRCPSRESSPTPAKSISRNLQSSSSNKIDRVIAELLIDALNRPDELGIEIIKSPKDMTYRDKSNRRQAAPRRNTPRRSANSGKYQQVFEVIPEERSSFSVDSSAEEPSKASKESTSKDNTSVTTTIISSSTPISSQKTLNRGRVAVDRAEPKAWIGFFKRHNDSSMDEDDGQTQPYASSSTENSRQHTITSPSTITAAAGSTTPKVSTGVCPTSSESDNILKLIDNTFVDESVESERQHTTPQKVVESTVTVAFTAIDENTTKSCRSCKLKDTTSSDSAMKIGIHQTSETSSSPTSSTAEASSNPKDEYLPKKVTHNHRTRKGGKVDVWRVQSPDICKMAIPKSKMQSKKEENLSTATTHEVDSRSFIIVADECVSSPSRQNFTSKIPVIGQETAEHTPNTASNQCTSCCYCNPELHKSSNDNAARCVYCNRKKTPQKKEEETNTETDFFLNHHVYQSMSKTDHTHTRTRSRDSDVVSTKCTKINEKIKKYIPEEKIQNNRKVPVTKAAKNITRPKNVPNLPKTEHGAVNKVLKDDIKLKYAKTKHASPDGKAFRFPSPYANLSSNSYDRTTSPSSSSDSTCPTTPSRCPLLPASRRPNFPGKQPIKRRTYKQGDAISSNNNKATVDNVNNNSNANDAKSNGQNNGWSVTVAGSYNQNLAPDLEMRLSFPKQMQQQQQAIQSSNSHITEEHRNVQTTTNGNIYAESLYHDEDIVNDNYSRNHHHALPPAGNMNPKRTLTRIVSERTHSQRDINFPEVNASRNPMVSRQMAKKAIKHMECSVAMTSATRTISNFTRGRRTMSYQALNTESHKANNRERHVRDNSLDLGNLSSRRMSLDSQTPSECMALSIMGNAIAPEQKPRVPTMSEKDLTRRHNTCFTRNRAFFT